MPSGNKPLPKPMLTQIYVTKWHHWVSLLMSYFKCAKEASNPYLNEWWSRSITPYGTTRPQCVISVNPTTPLNYYWSHPLAWSLLIISIKSLNFPNRWVVFWGNLPLTSWEYSGKSEYAFENLLWHIMIIWKCQVSHCVWNHCHWRPNRCDRNNNS